MSEDKTAPTRYTTDTAFSDSVKAVQETLGSRGSMERLERSDTWPEKLDSDIKRWIKARDSVFLGSSRADGQPYIQRRGGEPGFITIPDDKTLLIPDYRGNRQYLPALWSQKAVETANRKLLVKIAALEKQVEELRSANQRDP